MNMEIGRENDIKRFYYGFWARPMWTKHILWWFFFKTKKVFFFKFEHLKQGKWNALPYLGVSFHVFRSTYLHIRPLLFNLEPDEVT